ncbi:MAG: tRNA (guanosine(46)-N7)-methyltransferase TrmB [Planctomycetota bacterium]
MALPPLDWARHFGRRAPLAVEVGFGNGEFLVWWSRRNPDWNLVGLEFSSQCLARAARALSRAGSGNVHLVFGDARFLLRELFSFSSLRLVMVQFPFPWPKARHAKHRLFQAPFAATLADVLVPGGELVLVTDQEWYARDAGEVLRGNGSFEVGPLETGPERPFRTRYEKKWLEEGRFIHRLEAVLKHPRPVARICLPGPVPAFPLSGRPAWPRLEGLAGIRWREPGRVVEVKQVVPDKAGWGIKLLAADGSFAQLFSLRLEAGAGGAAGEWSLQVAEPERLYHTPAVDLALTALGRELDGAAAPQP